MSFFYLLARCACLTNESPDWSSSDSFFRLLIRQYRQKQLNSIPMATSVDWHSASINYIYYRCDHDSMWEWRDWKLHGDHFLFLLSCWMSSRHIGRFKMNPGEGEILHWPLTFDSLLWTALRLRLSWIRFSSVFLSSSFCCRSCLEALSFRLPWVSSVASLVKSNSLLFPSLKLNRACSFFSSTREWSLTFRY